MSLKQFFFETMPLVPRADLWYDVDSQRWSVSLAETEENPCDLATR